MSSYTLRIDEQIMLGRSLLDYLRTLSKTSCYVEILPQKEEKNNQSISFKKLKGCLKEYANPDLWEKEQYAWENNIVEKYGTL